MHSFKLGARAAQLQFYPRPFVVIHSTERVENNMPNGKPDNDLFLI